MQGAGSSRGRHGHGGGLYDLDRPTRSNAGSVSTRQWRPLV